MAEVDLISNLPNALLGVIVSFLPGTECVRTSILSQHWKIVWNYSSHLNLDQKQMFRKSIEIELRLSDPITRLQMAACRKDKRYAPSIFDQVAMDEIVKASMLITSIIDGHIGPLKSCSIRHFPESCASGEVVGWIMKLLEKKVRKISMELELPNMSPYHQENQVNQQVNPIMKTCGQPLDFPFEVFSNFQVLELKNYRLVTSPSSDSPQLLKTLTLNGVHITPAIFQGILSHCSSLENLTLEQCDSLKNQVKIVSSSLKFFKISKMVTNRVLVSAVNLEVMEIDSISCHHQKLAFEIPKLQVLRFYNDIQRERQLYPRGTKYLTTKDIIEIVGGMLGPQASGSTTIFENLVTLSIDFDLKGIGNTTTLSFALKSCHNLKNLQINNQVIYNDLSNNTSKDGGLPNPASLFWQRMELCECVSRQLKSLCIKGYTGKGFEMEFVKYIITNAGAIEKITLWFVDKCSWVEATATLCLLTFPKASSKLKIDLKPGTKYMSEVGGSFEKWVTTL